MDRLLASGGVPGSRLAPSVLSGCGGACHRQRLTADGTAPVATIHRRRVTVQRMLHVETASMQLDGKAAVTQGLPIRLSQEFVEGIPQAVP